MHVDLGQVGGLHQHILYLLWRDVLALGGLRIQEYLFHSFSLVSLVRCQDLLLIKVCFVLLLRLQIKK